MTLTSRLRIKSRSRHVTLGAALLPLLCALATIGLGVHAPSALASTGTTYYVDSQTGNDANSGTSPSAPWQSLAKVDAATFQPGDQILLADGSEWSGVTLSPQGSGDASADITIGSYGSGSLPRIDGAGQVPNAVELFNQQHWTIQDIEVTNEAPATSTPGANLGDFRGIYVGGDDGQTLTGFTVNSVYVHDVTGVVDWIGGSTSNDQPGINFQTGWDGSKNTGGVVFQGTVADPANPGQPTVLNDMTVENSTIENTSFAGIVTKQYSGTNAGAVATGWGTRTGISDSNYHPLTNLTIEGNYITQAGTPYGANGLYVTGVEGALIQGNLVDQVGTCGIELDYSDNATVQHNEVDHVTVKAGGGDSNAIDTDMGTTNMVVQYNYAHDNGVGFLVYQVKFGGNSIWRYNVVTNSAKESFQLGSDNASTAAIYNNTIYNTSPTDVYLQSGSAQYAFTNNVFYSTAPAAAMATSTGITYQSNYYGGPSPAIPISEIAPVTGDARFTSAPATGPYGTEATGPQLATADAYEQTSGSALIDSGVPVSGNGGIDYAGNTLYNNAPDIGAFEYSTPAGATGEAIDGTLTSSAGGQLSGATVTVSSQGQTLTTTSDANGYYAILNVPFGPGATVTVSAANYKTLTTTAAVADGDSTRLDLTVTTTLTTGTIQGQVDDDHANPLSGASVTLSSGSHAVATAVSSAAGTYSFPAVSPGTSYQLTASASGYRPATISGVSVSIAHTTAPATLILPTTSGTVLQTHDFNSLPLGPLATGTDGWTTSAAGGSVGVVADTPGTNQSLQVSRGSNSGSTDAELDFSVPLQGLITVEADVKRTDQPGTHPADYFSAPYVYGSSTSSTPAVAVATSQGAIEAYEGTTIDSLVPYATGTWYHLALVIDTVNQTYDLYVDGKEVVANAAFRTGMPGIQRIAYYANSSNYGTELIDNVRVGYGLNPQQNAGPAQAVLSTTQGWADGLDDGYYNVEMNNRRGNNATSFSLYENGTLLYTEPLLDNGDSAQTATVTIGGRPNGTYTYTGVLTNSAGATATSTLTVHVTDANPGTPVVSDNGYHGAANATITTNMWWGTNATDYQLYVDGTLVDSQQLTAATPAAQQVTTTVTGLSPGTHQVIAVLSNQYGSTSSHPLTLTVTQ